MNDDKEQVIERIRNASDSELSELCVNAFGVDPFKVRSNRHLLPSVVREDAIKKVTDAINAGQLGFKKL